MDTATRVLEIAGIVLQTLGALVGFDWFIEKLTGYSPLIYTIAYFAVGFPDPEEMLQDKVARNLQFEYDKRIENRYIPLHPKLVMFIIFHSMFYIGISWGAIALLVFYLIPRHEPNGYYLFGVILVGVVLIALARIEFSIENGSTVRGSWRWYLKEFFRMFGYGMIVDPLIATGQIFVTILLVVLNSIAWMTKVLPTKYHVNLAIKKHRETYYRGFAVITLLAGTGLLITSILMK